ncbi:hypothetical protein NM688_g3255 [Phlebia brevispora]|uniref:Uncharacterized protein n=1 Tax=Phlebia brevispora TaxID=194682 RepID=A0ACC1T619_9APHY|nr:hypothetical protein NM688_g3255 [Phlebia brevispora]
MRSGLVLSLLLGLCATVFADPRGGPGDDGPNGDNDDDQSSTLSASPTASGSATSAAPSSSATATSTATNSSTNPLIGMDGNVVCVGSLIYTAKHG